MKKFDPLMLARSTYYLIEESVCYSFRKLKYGRAAFNARNTINISPKDIEYKISGLNKKPKPRSQIISGDWDIINVDDDHNIENKADTPKKTKFDHYPFFKIVQKEYEGSNINDIDFVEVSERYDTHDKESLRYYYKIYQRINENGYRCAIELGNWFPIPECHEINIAIGRNGEIYKIGGGNHRLAISKVLDINSVPAFVRVRHPKWQKKRDKIRSIDNLEDSSEALAKYSQHPDIPDDWV